MAREIIRIYGMKEFTQELRKATEDKSGTAILRDANMEVARFVIRMAKREANGKMENKAAASLNPSRALAAVRVVGGSDQVPYFAGANFGAYRNKVRIVKAPVIRDIGAGRIETRKTRATLVRGRGSQREIDQIVKRIERQYVDTRGRTVTEREGGIQVRVKRNKNGSIRKMRGWNQFGRWRKGKDNFLYKAIGKHWDKIVDTYFDEMERAMKKAFPD